MKRLITLFVICTMLLGVGSVAHADARWDLFNDFMILAGLPESDAWYWADYLCQTGPENAEMRAKWSNVGLIDISAYPASITLTPYGIAAVYNMIVELRDEFIGIGVGTLGSGVPESKAQFLFF